ncbi:STAS domain-containing protein [Nonomuraea sp. NPDC050663]|uniref:STAS domain-containing protein n=1 Tax=Nonomuraea sp. NPDC050663 TaxID=3364370 RepID=UPI0037A1C88C
MEYSLREIGDVTIVTASGEIDAATLPPLSVEVLKLLGRPRQRLIIDLSTVAFLDSTGLALLVRATNQSRENGGRLAVIGADPVRLRVIWLTHLDKFLPLHDSLEAALEQVQALD